MKIIVVGATGTIGRAVVDELAERHEIIKVGRKSGDVNVDITSADSISKMYEAIGAFDALVSTTGSGYFGDFSTMTEAQCYIGIRDKLMGQVNLVLIGRNYINDAGSFTLTSGVLSQDPVRGGAAMSMINAALDGFVVGAAIELPKGIRINSISPGVIQESMDQYASVFRGHEPVPVSRVARAYSKSVEGFLNGQIFRVL